MGLKQFATASESFIRRAIHWVSMAAGFSLFLMMIITVIDVTIRLVGEPLLGFFEITSLLLVCLVFFGLAQTQAVKANVRVDIFIEKLPVFWQHMSDLFTGILCLGLSVLMGYQTWLQFLDTASYHETTGTLFIPLYPFYLIIVFGFFLLILVFILEILHSIKNMVNS